MKKVRIVLPLMLIALVSISMKAQRIGFVNINAVVDTLYFADSTQFLIQQAQATDQQQLEKIRMEANLKEKESSKLREDSISTSAKLAQVNAELAEIQKRYDLAAIQNNNPKTKKADKIDIVKVVAEKDAKIAEKAKLEKAMLDNSVKTAALSEDMMKLVEQYQMIQQGTKESDQMIQDAVQKASLDYVSECATQVAKAKGFTQIMNGSPTSLLVNLAQANTDVTSEVIKIAIRDRKTFRIMYFQYYGMMMKNYEAQKQYYQQLQQMQQQGRGPSTGGGQ